MSVSTCDSWLLGTVNFQLHFSSFVRASNWTLLWTVNWCLWTLLTRARSKVPLRSCWGPVLRALRLQTHRTPSSKPWRTLSGSSKWAPITYTNTPTHTHQYTYIHTLLWFPQQLTHPQWEICENEPAAWSLWSSCVTLPSSYIPSSSFKLISQGKW